MTNRVSPNAPANYIPPADPLGPSFKLNYIDEALSMRKQPDGSGSAGVQDYYFHLPRMAMPRKHQANTAEPQSRLPPRRMPPKNHNRVTNTSVHHAVATFIGPGASWRRQLSGDQ